MQEYILMIRFYPVLLIPLLFVLSFVLAGYLMYKMGKAKSWANGIVVLLAHLIGWVKKIVKALYSFWIWLNHDDIADYRENTFWILDEYSLNSFIDALKADLYEVPSFAGVTQNNGIYRLIFNAVDVKEKYRNLEPPEIERIAKPIVSEFWRREKGSIPEFIVAATRHQCIIYIPLSIIGRKNLISEIAQIEENRKANLMQRPSVDNQMLTEIVDVEEEEFDIFGDKGDSL